MISMCADWIYRCSAAAVETLPQHELRLPCTWSQGGASPAMRPMSSAGRPITGFVRPSTSSARPNTGSSGNPGTALTTALKAARPGTGAANRPVTSSGRCARTPSNDLACFAAQLCAFPTCSRPWPSFVWCAHVSVGEDGWGLIWHALLYESLCCVVQSAEVNATSCPAS